MVRNTDGDANRQEALGQEYGHRDAEETADHQGQQGAVQRPPDFRQDTELGAAHVPGRGDQKPEAVFSDGRQGLAADFIENVNDQQNDDRRTADRGKPEAPIAEIVALRGRTRHGFRGYRLSEGIVRHALKPQCYANVPY